MLDPDENENEIHCIQPSLYYEMKCLPSYLKNKGHFNILSLNIQGINAKFDALLSALEIAKQQNIFFGDICFQEAWLKEDADLALFQIPGYLCISKGKMLTTWRLDNQPTWKLRFHWKKTQTVIP